MANSVTFIDRIFGNFGGSGGDVRTCAVSIDTVNTDLEILAPAPDHRVAVFGCFYVRGAAHVLTFRSGVTSLVAPEFGLNSGLARGISKDPLIVARMGETLKIASSVAIPSMFLAVGEIRDLRV